MAVDGRGRAGGTSRWQGRSEVRLLLCNGRNGPIALEFGVTVINRHRPWACPKRAPHFQVGAGDHQLAESLHGWRGEELSEKSGCWGPRGACLSDTSEGGGAWKQQAGLAALTWAMRRPGDLFPAPTPGHGDDRVPALGEEGEDEQLPALYLARCRRPGRRSYTQATSFLPGQTEDGVRVPAWPRYVWGQSPNATEPCCPTCEMGQLFLL